MVENGKKIAGSIAYGFIQTMKSIFTMMPGTCRFVPSCSQYASEAIAKLPIWKAIILILWRVMRCNPLSKGGYDPVAEK